MAFRSDIEALILASLEGGPKYGYDIARHIKERSADRLKLGEGQLYPVLHRLQKQGMVEGEWEIPEGATPRKMYALTEDGRARLMQRRKDWRGFIQGVSAVLGTNEPKAVKTDA